MNYPKINHYTQYIFDFFRRLNCKEGQGLMFRIIKFSMEKNISRPDQEIIVFLLNTLIQNGYIEIKDSPTYFLSLTQKGSDVIWGDEVVSLKYDLNSTLTNQYRNRKNLYEVLWKIIGPQNEAILYVTGPEFYNTIKPYIFPSLHGSYSDYMKELKNSQQSTSRISWYRSLFEQLSEEDLYKFLRDLSSLINSKVAPIPDETDSLDSLVFENNTNEETVMAEIQTPIVSESGKNSNETLSPKALISYAWETDDENFMEWILQLAKDLRLNGIDAQLDRYQPHGTDLVRFMLEGVRTSDKVLCILTPKYKEKAESGKGGASYEGGIISHEIYDNQDTIKFIPILRKGSFETVTPDFIKGRKGFMCVTDEQYNKELLNIIKAIKGEPIVEIPPIKN